ncbi:CYFA0S06e01904g1_1 [Cyberlindnera fabianii]|uniref:CYFA0S06e01904g1_1 n=1 Tax=Cyberlindnera fabianii TaxID=36022 RepID=A0A061B0G2_CYBFA|nr:CYFA0S06e01904g1_1 [Cyberlindnera fabianii]
MSPKRPNDTAGEVPDLKRPKSDVASDKEDKIRRAKERIAQLKAAKAAKEAQKQQVTPPAMSPATSVSPPESKPTGRGLDVELHPLLTGKPMSTPLPIENPNLQRVNARGFQVNPYLSSISTARRKRELKFSEKGQYIAQAEQLRKQKELEEKKRRLDEMRRKAGLEPDLNIHEEKYKPDAPPAVEWWDLEFLESGDYDKPQVEKVSLYLQHPVPIPAPWESHVPEAKAPHLTKKEMKRKRRNERAERYQEQQDRIKLGLEAPPPPKVKLSNLMSALTNEAIKDPTAVEKRVRQEVEARRLQHEATNEERKLTKEQKHEKIEQKKEKDIQKGYYSAVFIVDKLEHPSHRFKVDTNAQQLGLVGTAIYGETLVLIVVEGSEKSIRFYKNLLLKRIKWQVGDGSDIDLSGNKCELLWEGQLREFHFKKWGIFHAEGDAGAIEYLSHFGVDSYYREALSKRGGSH